MIKIPNTESQPKIDHQLTYTASRDGQPSMALVALAAIQRDPEKAEECRRVPESTGDRRHLSFRRDRIRKWSPIKMIGLLLLPSKSIFLYSYHFKTKLLILYIYIMNISIHLLTNRNIIKHISSYRGLSTVCQMVSSRTQRARRAFIIAARLDHRPPVLTN